MVFLRSVGVTWTLIGLLFVTLAAVPFCFAAQPGAGKGREVIHLPGSFDHLVGNVQHLQVKYGLDATQNATATIGAGFLWYVVLQESGLKRLSAKRSTPFSRGPPHTLFT